MDLNSLFLIETPFIAARKYLSKNFSQVYCSKIEQIEQLKEKNKSKMLKK